MNVTEEYIGNKSKLTELFHSGCKKQQLIGLEYEKLPVYKSDCTAVSYEDITKIIRLLYSENTTPIEENGNLTGLVMSNGHISLEPGSQFEISLNPTDNIADIRNELDIYNARTAEIADSLGICWLGAGIQPVSTYEKIKIIPKKRYEEMSTYLPTKGKLPFVMMRETAGIQVGIDYSSEEDASAKLKTAIKLSPVVSAIFADSPVRNSRLTGSKSFRAYSWLNTDEDRCGLISEKLFEPKREFTFDDYAEVLLNVPMIFISKNNKLIPTGRLTFGEYLKNGFEGFKATYEDWNTHLSLYFSDVRIKSYLEIRNHDSQCSELITSVPALWKGILYTEDARIAADEIFKGAKYEDFAELRYITPDKGLDCRFGKYPLYDSAAELLNIAFHSLEKMKKGEERFLRPIMNIVSQKKTPADLIIEKLSGINNITPDNIRDLNLCVR